MVLARAHRQLRDSSNFAAGGMAIEKRVSKHSGKVSYRVRLRLSGGRQFSSTHARLSDARDWECETLRLAKACALGPSGEAAQRTVGEAIDRYLELLPNVKLNDERNRRRQLAWWRAELGKLTLAQCTAARIATCRDKLLATPICRPGGTNKSRQPATVVRYLAALSHVLTVATDDWGWLPDNPVRKVRKPRQPRGRLRFLSDNEREALLAACRLSTSPALYPAVVLALTTGMRRGEILGLRWSDVNLADASLRLDTTKNGERRIVPLVGHALEVIRALRATAPQDAEFVFAGVKSGRPRDIATPWSTAVRRAGLVDFRFHDLRHTTASYLAMRGASLLEVGAVLGHKSAQMTKRYAHLSADHTRRVLSGMAEEMMPGA
jgi:integrase